MEGKADRTLVLYGQSVTHFADWLRQRGQPTDLSNLDRDTDLRWLDFLRARGLTTDTIRARWRGLRRFINWLLVEDIIDTDPLAGIVIDQPEPPPVPILTDQELAALSRPTSSGFFGRFPRLDYLVPHDVREVGRLGKFGRTRSLLPARLRRQRCRPRSHATDICSTTRVKSTRRSTLANGVSHDRSAGGLEDDPAADFHGVVGEPFVVAA